MSVRRYSCLILGAAAVLCVRADEKTKPPAPPPTADGISSAKRDFDSIRTSRSPIEQQRLDVPQVSTPTLHLGDDYSAYSQSEAAKRKEQEGKKAKSNNWLVDAMQDKHSAAAQAAKPAEAFKSEGEREESTLLTLNAEETARTASKNLPDVSRTAPTADNPLTNYMSSWMTTKDYDLLKVKPADTDGVSAANKESDPAMFDGLMRGNNSTGSAPHFAGNSPDRAPNPYLADFAPPPASPTKDNTPAHFSGAIDLGPSLLPPLTRKNDVNPLPPTPPPVDVLKPSSDSKYFPQLKRF